MRGGSGLRASRQMGRTPDPPVKRMTPEQRSRTLRRIAGFFRPYRAAVVVVMSSIILTALIGTINPYLLKVLIDDALPNQDFALLNLCVGLMIVLPIMSGLIGVAQTYLNNVVGQHVMQDLRNALYAHLQKMPLRFFTETRTGEIQSRLANDVGGVQTVVTDTASSVFSNLITATVTLLAMAWLSWQLTLLSLAVLPFFLWLTHRVGKIRRGISTETQESLADVTAITQETLSVSGILLSKTFGQQEASIHRYRIANARLAALSIRQNMVGRWFFMIVGTIFSIMPAFVYWLAGYLAISGSPDPPTVGDIVAFTTLQSRLFFPLGQLLSVQVEVYGALALFDRIFEYLDLRPAIEDAPGAVTLDRASIRGSIRFRHVSFHYPGAIPSVTDDAAATAEPAALDATDGVEAGPTAPPIPFALDDVDFSVEPGQLVALVGHSGSGKTTTTYLVPRLYDVDDGAVEIDGTDVRQVTQASLGDIIGVVTQETYLFHSTVRTNLLYARPEATDEELHTAARLAANPRPDRGAPRWLRHGRRRAGLQAVGRREAAHRSRAGAAQGPPHPHPRRGDQRPGHGQRAAHPDCHRAHHGGAHHPRHRPPPLHHPARGPHPGL